MADTEKSTHDAFDILVNSPYYWSLTKLPTSHRRQAAYRLKNGLPISLGRKEELLTKAGFTVKQQTRWNLPKGS